MLDYAVARTVHAARLLELAWNSDGEWTIAIGSAVSPARRIITDRSIIIIADFAPQCWVNSPRMTAELSLDGICMSVRPIKVPDDEVTFAIRWMFEVPEPEVASVTDRVFN
jgi:hypothetical protein